MMKYLGRALNLTCPVKPYMRIHPYLLPLFMICASMDAMACPNIMVSFNIQTTGNCVPLTTSISNNSTGSMSANAVYRLYVNGVLRATQSGKSSFSHTFPSRGSYVVMIKSTDTSGCVDSSKTTYNVAKAKPKFIDYTRSPSDNPEWINCIQQLTDPDSLSVLTYTSDSLQSLRVIWGDGATDSVASPVKTNSVLKHTYTTTGVMQVLFIYRDTAGCVDTVFGKVTNERVPTAGIIGPNSGYNVGCVPFKITFRNNSSNISSGTIFTWDFGDDETKILGSSTFNDFIEHEYLATLCSGTVRLTASNACGYSLTTWNPIQVSNKDRAIFTIDSSNCDGTGNLLFTNYSTDSFCIIPDPKEYFWDFGDGTNSGWISSKGPQYHNYKNQGPTRVCLIAKNKCGQDTSCAPINVVYTPVAGFIIDTTKGCGSLTIQVEDTSRGFGLSRLWDFGDSTFSTAKKTSHTYDTPGIYNLKLTVSNRCGIVSDSVTIRVRSLPSAGISNETDGCVIHTVNFTNTSTTDFPQTARYLWNFGNLDTSHQKTPPQIEYKDSGTFNIRLILTDSCGTDTAQTTVVVEHFPDIEIVLDSVYCATDSIRFVNISSNYSSMSINFGDGTASLDITGVDTFYHVYSSQGYYRVLVTAQNGTICSAFDTSFIRIKANAVAKLSTNSTLACAPFLFQLTNTSNFANTLRWYRNDTLISNNPSGLSLPVITDSTVLNIKLVAVDSNSCHADSVSIVLKTAKNPVAGIGKQTDSACSPYAVNFDNTSKFATTYQWNLGNGKVSTDFEPNTMYHGSLTRDTVYQVRLIARNWMACADTLLATRKIFPNPTSTFTLSNPSGCGPLTSSFSNQSQPNDTGNIAMMSFIWDFGDGSTGFTTHPASRQYTASKISDSIYRITLIGISEHGCRDTFYRDLTVYPNPTISFSPDTLRGCGPLSVKFTNSSVPNDTGSIAIMKFRWNLGNGQTSQVRNPSTFYPASLTSDTSFTVRCVGETEHGCPDSATGLIHVYPKPLAAFNLSINEGCSPLIVTAGNRSTPYDTGSINIMKFRWNYGNGIFGNHVDSSMTYFEAPLRDTTYVVQLIGISEHGCLDTATAMVKVYPTPFTTFVQSDTAGCAPLTVQFDNRSQLNDTNFWKFGNAFLIGPRDTVINYPRILLMDSVYNLSLYTKSRYGCISDTATARVKTYGHPIADFAVVLDSLCPYDSLKANNLSKGAAAYKWFTGDGGMRTTTHLTYQYQKDANPFIITSRTLELEVFSIHGCKDSVSSVVIQKPYPVAKIAALTDSLCSPITVGYRNQSVNAPEFTWYFDDFDSSKLNIPFHFYTNVSNIVRKRSTRLFTRNSYGCEDWDSAHFYLKPEPIAFFSPFRMSICDSGDFRMDNASVNNYVNLWDFGDGSTSQQIEPLHRFKRDASVDRNYLVNLRVMNRFGCSDTTDRQIALNPWIAAGFDTAKQDRVCVEQRVRFTDKSKNARYYLWYFGDSARSNEANPEYFYKQPGVYNVKQVVYDLNGCPDSLTINALITVLPKPRANFSFLPQFPKMPDGLVRFTNQSIPVGSLLYQWDFDDNGRGSTVKDPSHQYPDSGWYNVRLIADNGRCLDTIIRPLYIEPPFPTIDFNADDTSGCGPFTVKFKAVGKDATNYRWFFDDGTESRDSAPTHTFVNEGFYTISLVAYGPGGQSDTGKMAYIRVYPNPVASFYIAPTEKYLPNAFFSTVNESVDGKTFQWKLTTRDGSLVQENFDENLVFQINQPGEFNVELIATNHYGCPDTMIRQSYLRVFESGKVFVPNAFTPTTSPDNNDVFRPVLTGVDPKGYNFKVYNRWGEKIWETSNPSEGWDGIYQNSSSPVGMYLFRLEGLYFSGQEFMEQGMFLLLK